MGKGVMPPTARRAPALRTSTFLPRGSTCAAQATRSFSPEIMAWMTLPSPNSTLRTPSKHFLRCRLHGRGSFVSAQDLEQLVVRQEVATARRAEARRSRGQSAETLLEAGAEEREEA